jgi:hypothetical protein
MRPAERIRGHLHWLALAPTLLLNLWHLRAERLFVQSSNDGAMHAQMVRFARRQLDSGTMPLHAWYPYLQLGSPHFQHYPSLGHTLTAGVSYLIGVDNAFPWSVYLLLALWPLSVFLATRILGLGPWVAVAAATATPLIISTPGYGYEYGSYVWAGWGVWGQLWAMVALPLAIAWSWRAVMTGRDYARAGAALGITMALHFQTGYLSMLAIGIGALLVRGRLLSRVARAAAVVAAAVAVASFELVPLIQGRTWTAPGDLDEASRFYVESHGARQVLRWFVHGELYDGDGAPVVTVLVVLGIVASALRWRHPRARLLLSFWVLSMFLFFGPKTFGSLLTPLPGAQNLLYHRMIIGVHLSGIWLAGVGALAVVRWVRWLGGRVPLARSGVVAQIASVVALVVLALTVAWPRVTAVSDNSRAYIEFQQIQEEAELRMLEPLIARVRAGGDGRVYAGLRANWGKEYKVGAVPVYSVLAGADLDVVGFTYRTPSLMADVEAYFLETSLHNYDLFNVRYLLLPADRPPPVPAELLGSSGRHRLWSVDTTGYVRVVDTLAPISVPDPGVYLTRARPTLYQDRSGELASLEYAGRAPAPVTRVIGVTQSTPGRVTAQAAVLDDGTFTARVSAQRPAAVVLKVAFDPGWRATVDGAEAGTFIAAPGLVGIMVAPGEHVVVFTFRSAPPTWLYLLVGALALVAARAASRRGPRPAAAGEQQAVDDGPEDFGPDGGPGRGEGAVGVHEEQVGGQVDAAEGELALQHDAHPADRDEGAGGPEGDEVRDHGDGEDRRDASGQGEAVAEEQRDGPRPDHGETDGAEHTEPEGEPQERPGTGLPQVTGVLGSEARPEDVAVDDDRDG